MSLADFTIIILMALSTVTTVSTLNPILVGDCARALAETRNGVSNVMRPSLTARRVV